MSGSPGSLWKDYSSLSHRRRWGENKIIGRFHSPLVKSRHNLKGIWGKQASEIWKQKRRVRKTQRVVVGSVGEGTQAAKSWWPGDRRGQKCHPWQQPQAMWHLRCPGGISYFVGGDSVRSWDLGQMCTCKSTREPPGFWCFSFLVKLGRHESQHNWILLYPGVMNTTMCTISCGLKNKDRLLVPWDERLGLGCRGNVEFQGHG